MIEAISITLESATVKSSGGNLSCTFLVDVDDFKFINNIVAMKPPFLIFSYCLHWI